MRISDWSSDVCSSDLLAVTTRKRADLRPRTGLLRHPLISDSTAGFAVAHTDRSARRSVEQRVVRTQVQCRVVEHEMTRNRTELAACFFSELFVPWMQLHTIPVLPLAGTGDLVILLRQA